MAYNTLFMSWEVYHPSIVLLLCSGWNGSSSAGAMPVGIDGRAFLQISLFYIFQLVSFCCVLHYTVLYFFLALSLNLFPFIFLVVMMFYISSTWLCQVLLLHVRYSLLKLGLMHHKRSRPSQFLRDFENMYCHNSWRMGHRSKWSSFGGAC